MNNYITIIDTLCYLYPHRPELRADAPQMKGTWQQSFKLSQRKNTYFAPLLIDDIRRTDHGGIQTVDEIVEKALGLKYKDLRWWGKPIYESDIEKRYGDLGCKIFDSIYHRDIILSLALTRPEWKYIAVQPESFKAQQSGMLLDLWKFIYSGVNFGARANVLGLKTERLRELEREQFLAHFEHHWIGDDGTLKEITKPVYRSKKICHEKIA